MSNIPLLNNFIFLFWAVPVDLQPETTPPTGNASDVLSVLPTPEALAAVAQLFQSSHAQEVSSKLF